MRTRTLSICFLLLVSACSGVSDEISAQIEAQFNASSTAPIDLALVGPSTWERVCVLGPYTMNENAEKILGFKWDANGKTSIGSNDGINVLVFVQGSEVIAYTEYPRGKGDFSHMVPRCLPRDRATVVRQPDPDPRNNGWVFLVAEQQGLTLRSTGLRKSAQPLSSTTRASPNSQALLKFLSHCHSLFRFA